MPEPVQAPALRAVGTEPSIVDLVVPGPTTRSLSFRPSAAPAAIVGELLRVLARLSRRLGAMAREPPFTASEAARRFVRPRLPAPAFVIVRPVAVSGPESTSELAAGVTVNVVSLASVIALAML